ncbi:putative F-box/FBD/LRR-repeat protein At1g78760 [Lotus japonicus]|uniref:putative F-box/FBD/LRR-repeat protein At1g78760 n=1 Tax=Lotus japonicus TaxID=34305 RepID=UPI00258E23FD|nr:putative F-box/FBD/LRR-repeat protein At1g78760 [Lotus japonicus]
MSNSTDEMLMPPKAKRGRQSLNENENEDNKDRLSDLPDCILLHILSFVKAKAAVQTCILSTRWKDLWKRLPSLILLSSNFWTYKSFTKFVSRLLTLRDGSTALHGLDFEHDGHIQPHLLKRIVKYAVSHNVQRLGLSVTCAIEHFPPSVFSCETLTSLKLAVQPKGSLSERTLLPKSLNLPALTTLHLEHFAFCANDNDRRAEPFSSFKRLNSLIVGSCSLSDADILCISNTSLCHLTVFNQFLDLYEYNIELSSPGLHSFAFTGTPYQLLSESSNLSSIEEVNIDVAIWYANLEKLSPLVLLIWLAYLANIKSLTVSTSTLQVLCLHPKLLKLKFPLLGSLKSLKVIQKPLSRGFIEVLREVKLQKATTKSPKAAAAMLPKASKEDSFSSIPDGIVDFLLQNSPSAKISTSWCPYELCLVSGGFNSMGKSRDSCLVRLS